MKYHLVCFSDDKTFVHEDSTISHIALTQNIEHAKSFDSHEEAQQFYCDAGNPDFVVLETEGKDS